MAMALTLGRRGRGNAWPNPAVGCVIVRDGRVVGRGWTQPGGRPHAETVALAQAGDAARGATAYVTLEPCAHHGQTPPCAEALVAAGIARVVAPIEDNDARVSGQGFAILRNAGIEVTTGVMAQEAARDLRGFILRTDLGRPFVTLKLATTLDGRIATATGESQWITGPEARCRVHALRAQNDAVMVGGGTARIDNPSLTVRDLGVDRQPVRIVASRRLDLPLMGVLARTAKEVPVWIIHGPDTDAELAATWRDLGAELLPCEVEGAQLSPASMLQALGAKGLNHVFCEGGGALAASLIGADMVDELVMFQAGFAIGAEGHPAIGALGLDRLSEAVRYRLVDQEQVGADLMSVWRRG
ncbi:bifunctional diaminohydroxyphosphoribosylaminopyrimidine deaminase/5-amino-6-(5-phosphoribosylamino)uracil reductase RibD [Shimia biformata]|uniref:bifunctional diaminohydroxyphosphoribosylaminopyrimidine deaminase/5-amino-6-(5-phosphoribosylamino)uracil reductase RibD n=1 Tax=Shimia biformata TaxID=1294299 RepID=UPI0019517542|nr:bifunctional diaminohydroxyphosphoribosylaminopyrimidine deaminase/5-amino-6-(5-phosphoribosylamino)uracil reductase RibD [Shimia biformata]